MAMTRRRLFGLFACSLAAFGVGGAAVAPTGRYGLMTPSRHRVLSQRGVHIHVIHKGRDITKRCCFADDTGEGMAEVYLHDRSGRKYRRVGEVAKEIIYGVTFQEGAPF